MLAYVPLTSFASISATYFSSIVLSKALTSFAVSPPNFAATALTTSSLVVSFATGCAVATGTSATPSFPPTLVVLSAVVLFDISSLA